jgi:excisionase family DNA binding protein
MAKIPQKLLAAAKNRHQLTTTQAADIAGYTRDHIGLLIRRGLLSASKSGRDWSVDAESLLDYVKKDPRPGPAAS